jgi:hypothetical protein
MPHDKGAVIAIAVGRATNALPASYDGSTLRFSFSLSSLLILSCLGLMVAIWMARQIHHTVRHRHAYPWDSLLAMQTIFMLTGFATFIRCAPEVAVNTLYREKSIDLAMSVLFVKRWLDTFAGPIGMGWMGLIYWYYPRMSSQLVHCSTEHPPEPNTWPKVNRVKISRILCAVVLICAISLLIGFGKTMRG